MVNPFQPTALIFHLAHLIFVLNSTKHVQGAHVITLACTDRKDDLTSEVFQLPKHKFVQSD